MPRHAKFQVKSTPSGWRVNVPASFAESRKRERHFHKTKAAALEHATKLREKMQEHGEAAGIIKPSLAEAATLAEALLAPWNVSLVEAARIVVATKERDNASRSVNQAVDAWLAAGEGLRERTLHSYKHTGKKLKGAFGERLLTTITVDELQEVIAPLGTHGAAVHGRIRNARAFWRWSAKRGWCDVNAFAGILAPKSGRDADEIAILTIEEAESLLRAAEANYPQAVASYAIQLFAGLRSEELTRLEAQHVSANGIELSASVTKKGRRRHINPSATLRAWLDEYPYTPCSNWRHVDKACRRLAGWDVSASLLKEPSEPTRGRWPQNALRHSHASYAVAAGTPLETLLFEFGHSGSPAILRQHYVGRASKQEAIKFFSLGPNGTVLATLCAA